MISKNAAPHSPSRRDLLKARIAAPSPQIASLIVQARPEVIPDLIPELNAKDGVEVHASNDIGRIIVTIEAESDQQLMDLMTAVQSQEHVINASLVYHQIED